MVKIVKLEQFDKVCGNVCLTIVLPRNAKISPIKTPDDLKEVLASLLKGVEAGEYPFLALSLAPLAYGKVSKKR